MYRKQLLTILISAAISGAAAVSFSVNAQAADVSSGTAVVQSEESAAPVEKSEESAAPVKKSASAENTAVQENTAPAPVAESAETAAPVSSAPAPVAENSAPAAESAAPETESAAPAAEDAAAEPEGTTPAQEEGTTTQEKETEAQSEADTEEQQEETAGTAESEENALESQEKTGTSENTGVQKAAAGTQSGTGGEGSTPTSGSTVSGSGITSPQASGTTQNTTAGDHLEGQDKILYDAARKQLPGIANAEKDTDADGRMKAIVSVPASRLLKETLGDKLVEDADNNRSYVLATDLGITEKITESTYTDTNGSTRKGTTADPVVEALFTYSIDKIRNALIADCPYDLYWFDKTENAVKKIDYTQHPYYYVTTTGAVQRICFDNERSTVSLKFPVTSDYIATATGSDDDPYTIDTAKAKTAVAARETADQIVRDTQSRNLSDLDTLKTYKDTICALTDYDHEASPTNKSYGNSWQMINVFDNNSSTNVTCEGYAKAMQYLCDNTKFQNSSVRCITVTGSLLHDNTAEDHMWNIVRWTDGNNYLVDVTNSDSGTAGVDGKFFMVPVRYTTVAELPTDIAERIRSLLSDNYSITDTTRVYYAPAGVAAGSEGILYYVYDNRTLRTFTSDELAVLADSTPVTVPATPKSVPDAPAVTPAAEPAEEETQPTEQVTEERKAVKPAAKAAKKAGRHSSAGNASVKTASSKISSGTAADTIRRASADTGDQAQPLIYSIMGAMAAAGLAVMRKFRKA